MAEQPSKSLALPPVVDLDSLDPIRDWLIDAIEEGPVTVSGAAVERVATNALFMLISAAETARRNNSAFAITDPSASMKSAIDRLGLASNFAGLVKG
jgi:anti-anti-sigma regulatory factor